MSELRLPEPNDLQAGQILDALSGMVFWRHKYRGLFVTRLNAKDWSSGRWSVVVQQIDFRWVKVGPACSCMKPTGISFGPSHVVPYTIFVNTFDPVRVFGPGQEGEVERDLATIVINT